MGLTARRVINQQSRVNQRRRRKPRRGRKRRSSKREKLSIGSRCSTNATLWLKNGCLNLFLNGIFSLFKIILLLSKKNVKSERPSRARRKCNHRKIRRARGRSLKKKKNMMKKKKKQSLNQGQRKRRKVMRMMTMHQRRVRKTIEYWLIFTKWFYLSHHFLKVVVFAEDTGESRGTACTFVDSFLVDLI